MKSIAVILTIVALAAPVCAHAAETRAAHAGVAQKSSAIGAKVAGSQSDGDPEPYVVHG